MKKLFIYAALVAMSVTSFTTQAKQQDPEVKVMACTGDIVSRLGGKVTGILSDKQIQLIVADSGSQFQMVYGHSAAASPILQKLPDGSRYGRAMTAEFEAIKGEYFITSGDGRWNRAFDCKAVK